MSLEDQYDAWVRGLMGGKKYAATSKQAEEASDAVQQMQASLDALTAAECGRLGAGCCAKSGRCHRRERAENEQRADEIAASGRATGRDHRRAGCRTEKRGQAREHRF